MKKLIFLYFLVLISLEIKSQKLVVNVTRYYLQANGLTIEWEFQDFSKTDFVLYIPDGIEFYKNYLDLRFSKYIWKSDTLVYLKEKTMFHNALGDQSQISRRIYNKCVYFKRKKRKFKFVATFDNVQTLPKVVSIPFKIKIKNYKNPFSVDILIPLKN